MRKILFVLAFLLSVISVQADEHLYQVIDFTNDSFVASYSTYSEAYEAMQKIEHSGIMLNQKLIAMDHGVVVLKHDECTVNVDVIYEFNEESGIVNGCYGNDGLYLKTNSSGTWVLMLMSNAEMWVKMEDVTLIPYKTDLPVSHYEVQNGRLLHQIQTKWESNRFGSTIDLGKIDFDADSKLYSYDGHYFYTDFLTMSNDVQSHKRDNALNANNPYYNYFMYLPHRSVTSYTSDEFEHVVSSLQINRPPQSYVDQNKDSINDILNVSQFVNNFDVFFTTQAEYGSNALLMFSLACNESAYGNSSLAFRRNNLFGHSAFDSDVEKNARRYASVENSVISHAKNFISSYANPDKFMYYGSFFGDKNSGMNVAYASDPYWGEKAAQYAWQMDLAMGGKDLDQEALALVMNQNEIQIYDQSLTKVISRIEDVPLMSFVVLNEIDSAYLVQLDENLYALSDSLSSYDMQLNIGYLLKRDVDQVLNREKIHQNQFETIVFKASGGVFSDGTDKKTLQFQTDSEVICEVPVLTGHVFDQWNQINDSLYEASYKKIKSISLNSEFPTITELNVPLNFEGAEILVEFEEERSEIVPVTSSMISGIDITQAGVQSLVIHYGGCSIELPFLVSLELDAFRKNVDEMKRQILDGQISEDQLQEQLLNYRSELQKEFYPVLSFDEITELDRLFQKTMKSNIRFDVVAEQMNAAVSGFYLCSQINDSSKVQLTLSLLPVEVSDDLTLTCLSQGWTIEEEFELKFEQNQQIFKWEGPMIVSFDYPDTHEKTMIVVTKDGQNIVRCDTEVNSGQIRFKAFQNGQYVVVSKPSINQVQSEPVKEVLYSGMNQLKLNAVFNWILLILLLPCVLIFYFMKRK